jgi:hypothetical protein
MPQGQHNTIHSSLTSPLKRHENCIKVSGNSLLFGPVNFIDDASCLLITAICFNHSQMLLSSTPKITAAL